MAATRSGTTRRGARPTPGRRGCGSSARAGPAARGAGGSDILSQKDPVAGKPFVDVVLDAAGQKGTGKWTTLAALDLGVPAETIAEAVFARNMSAVKEERVRASAILKGPAERFSGDAPRFI